MNCKLINEIYFLKYVLYTLEQKKRDSSTFSFLALTYWFNLNLMSILKKFSLFQQNHIFVVIVRSIIKQMDEISKFQVEKKCHKYNIILRRLKTHRKNKHTFIVKLKLILENGF